MRRRECKRSIGNAFLNVTTRKKAKKGVTRKKTAAKKRDQGSWLASVLAKREVSVLLRLAIALSFTLAIVWLASIPASDSQSGQALIVQENHTSVHENNAIDGLSYDDFTFYSKLKDFKIQVALDDSDTAPLYATHHLIQAGAFRRYDRAEEQLVSLTLLDLQPSIEEDKGWYRVLIGPLKTRGGMIAAKERLLENGIDAQVLTEKTRIRPKN